MSIKTLFSNIAEAIKEKNTSIVTVTPVEMPAAIRNITGGVELMTRTEWQALSIDQKRAKQLVAIEDTDTGYLRGVLIYGADYGVDWENITQFIFSGNIRSGSSYAQLGDIRFSDGSNYFSSQISNIASSTSSYGSFVTGGNQGDTRYLFDNNANTKTISSTGSGGIFKWSTTFTNPINIKDYSIMELWTANDSSDRDPVNNIVMEFHDTSGRVGTINLGSITMTTTRLTLGYTCNYQQLAE